jgi:hypothetical protein
LGTGTVATNRRTYKPYDEAVKFVHTLKLRNHLDWIAYCREERKDLPPKPPDIPANPDNRYGEEFREKGGWGGWLGTGIVANKQRKFRPYDEGVKFVHPLKLKNQRDWHAYYRGKRKDLPLKPNDIPSNPASTYGEEFRDKGGWGAWLGTGNAGGRRVPAFTNSLDTRLIEDQ